MNEEIKTNNNKYIYKKVFKYKNVGGKKKIQLNFFYGNEDYNYMISFEVKEKTFIYDIELKKGHRILLIMIPDDIKQDIKYQDKFELFLEALKKIKEENKIDDLYKETIELYSKKNRFDFLIKLFSKIYENKKCCELLIEKFYNINSDLKGKTKEKEEASMNDDRDKDLGKQFNNIMTRIESESDRLIKSNGYNPIHFYGVILSYFNYYDYNIFTNCFNKLYKDNPKNLYEILLIYHFQFFRPIKKDENDKEFFIDFFKYILSVKNFSFFTIGLKFILNIDTFIAVIDQTKEYIYEIYIEDKYKSRFFPIQLDDKLVLKKEKIYDIIKGIASICEYSEKIKKLLVYFKSDFWKSLLKVFEQPEQTCFKVCYELRHIFIKYNYVIEKICEPEKDKKIMKDIGDFYKMVAYHLNEKLKIFLKNKKEITNSEILGYIREYNPYYKEDKYKDKRDPYILEDLNFQYDLFNDDEDYKNEHTSFIKIFHALDYEDIFRDNMVEFLNFMVNKIVDISSFDTVIDLIRIDKIGGKANEYIQKLKNKYERLLKFELESLTTNRIQKPAEIIAKFEKLIFEQEKNIEFLKEDISKLSIRFFIYNELMKLCKDDLYKDMKDFIFIQYINYTKNIENIISLIDSFGEKDKINFLKELMKKCKFTKDEFYKAEENNKINLLYLLYKKNKLEKISPEIETTLTEIFEDLDGGKIKKKKLEEFFENKEEVIKKRLELIKLNRYFFEPENCYNKLKNTLSSIKSDIIALSKIKKSLSIFHKEVFREEIRKMKDYINSSDNTKISNYNKDEFIGPIKILKERFEKRALEVDLVKDFLLFREIYDNTEGKNQDIRFYRANERMQEIKYELLKGKSIDDIYEENKEIFNNIKKKLVKNEQRANEFFEKLKLFIFDGYEKEGENKENKQLMDDLILFFNDKKYEKDFKSIMYFFNCINKEDDWSKNLAKNYEKLSEERLDKLKSKLEELKSEGIYDYKKKNDYYKFFDSLYEKKEAIIFLIEKTVQDIDKFTSELLDKIDPNNPILTAQKIYDIEKCIEIFKVFMEFKIKRGNKEIFDYIKNLSPDEIKAFESYSEVYESIIELDRNEKFGFDIFVQIDKIITNAEFLFLKETEIFSYGEDNKISMDELIHLKNKIYITQKDIKKIANFEEDGKNYFLKIKFEKLLFFKELITNMEIIYDIMQELRNKGNNLPIKIKIIVKYNNKKEAPNYYLEKKEYNFNMIEKFLLNAKNDHKKKLEEAYKEKRHLRCLYGKLFIKIFSYLDFLCFDKIIDILRYILNKNNDEKIIETIPANPKIKNYINNYSDYNSEAFENIYQYFIDLFYVNNTSYRDHYEKMLIQDTGKYKGIYLHECEENSIEKFIYELFLQKIGKAQIAQNILLSNKETSEEEIQAFLNRAILCDFNTLFVVEINESFSDYQQGIMIHYLDELLKYKLNEYKNSKKGINIKKKETHKYLNSCLVFIYDKKNKEFPLVNEIGIFEKLDIQLDNNIIEENQIQLRQEINNTNITVFSSDKCGLGKSFQIRKLIEKKRQKYFYLTLGGILNKKDISNKLINLLKKINEENKKEKEKDEGIKIKNAIHLDLKESEEINLINEFLFSFLITKFYSYKENIIYIPKDIEIYIEIPNCFKDYLSQFGILKIFPNNIITLANKPILDLPKEIINIFNRLIGLRTNEEIEYKFLKRFICNYKYYSYYQINTFIKLFLSQFGEFDSEIRFVVRNEKGEAIKDVTENCIHDFIKITTYFLEGEFQNLIMREINEEKLKKENEDYIELLSETYKNYLKGKKFNIPLIFINKEKKEYEILKIDDLISKKINCSKYYLEQMKKFLFIENKVEVEKNGLKSLISILNFKSDNYVITSDIFTKMILLLYKILADIPVIIMGETGCGKTALITKLSQILNNGEIMVEIINIHPGITEKYLCQKMEEMNSKAEKQNKELWVFFDQINTCLSLCLLTEIFTNKTFNGKPLNNNIRLIGACNPYRKRQQDLEIYEIYNNERKTNLIYNVQPLPQSLLNLVLIFGGLNSQNEKEYIYNIIGKLFKEGEEKLHETTKEVIFNCHKYLRDAFDDPSIVSLRDINRFVEIVSFFEKYFAIKRKCEKEKNIENKENIEKLDKIRSIICSVYLCYYFRLIDESKRITFDNTLQPYLIELVNSIQIQVPMKSKGNLMCDEDESNEINTFNISFKISYKNLQYFFQENDIKYFSDFIKIEEQYLIDKIEPKKSICKNEALKENLFLMFVSIITRIPLIIVGKPCSSKSLAFELIYNSMKNEFSKNDFFKEFPFIIKTNFKGNEYNSFYDIEKLFEIAENKLNFYKNKEEYKNKLPISVILFDKLNLAEKSENNPLKLLNYKIENSKARISFIGLSNSELDMDNMNRAINLSVPNLDFFLDELIETAKSIVENISEELKENKIIEIISRAYYEYKRKLRLIKELMALKEFNEEIKEINKNALFNEIKIKKEYKNILRKEYKINEDFHSNRDFYYYIIGIAIGITKLDFYDEIEVNKIINNSIERNFGGIEYEIDIDFNLKLDIQKDVDILYDILKEKIEEKKGYKRPKKWQKDKQENEKNDKIIVSSVYLFKKLYNLECDNYGEKALKLENKEIVEYDINKCIMNNINDIYSRYLLLEISSSLIPLIIQQIKIQNNKDIIFLDGSPFKDDKNNNEYKFMKLEEIKSNANKDKLLIIKNLNQIHPFLIDLYNKNYIIKNEEKYVRIFFDSFTESLTKINDFFKIIIFVDKKSLNQFDLDFLSLFEKIKMNSENLLDDNQIHLSKRILEEINFKKYIEAYNINYSLKDCLINCGKKEIQKLIYYEVKKNKNKIDEEKIKETILNKIVKISPQDIISILPEWNIIKEKYLNEKKYYNLKSYIRNLNDQSPKITIIYTFDSIVSSIEGINNEMKFLISNIKSENNLNSIIKEIKYQNEKSSSYEKRKNIIYISFEQNNSNKIQYVSEYIKKNYKGNKDENKDDKYKYIFIIHIQRKFNKEEKSIIYSILDIDSDIEQLFIDSLNGPDIQFKDLLKKPIRDIMSDNSAYMNLNDEFNKLLESFVYKELNEKRNQSNQTVLSIIKELNKSNNDIPLKQKDNKYCSELIKYMENNPYLKEKIINKAKNFLSEDRSVAGTSQKLVERILQKNYIGKNSRDIISCVLNYIKEEIIIKYIKYIFTALEDNNVLTTLIEIQNDKNNGIDSSIIRELIENLIENLTYDENKEYNPRFLYNYRIPGFFNSYKNLLNYIKKNIAVDYFNLEKNLRKYDAKANVAKKKVEFLKKEKEQLSFLYEYLSNEEKLKFLFDNLEKRKIEPDIILKDFITFYLEEYDLKNKSNNDLIELLLNLRFNPEKNKIIEENMSEPNIIMLMKMIWLEANSNYIINILGIYSHAEKIFDKKKFLDMVKNKINNEDKTISYIINETRNPEYTREVNECYYILLASICYCLTDDEIELTEDLELENNNKIGIEQYLEVLKKINLNLQSLNTDLNISLNEMYIIDELIALFIENALIIQKEQADKFDDLVVNFENIYQKLNEEKLKEIKSEEDKLYEKKFYDTLKYIYLKEIQKIYDSIYRNKIFEKIVRDKEIIKRSGDIFEILLKKIVKTTTGEKYGFKTNLSNLKKGEVVNIIENNLKENKEDNYLALQEMILSFFEKSSLIYLDNVLEDEKTKAIDEGTPLEIFEECVKFLYKYNFTEKVNAEIKHIRKLFSIGYIKVYCNKFIEMINTNNLKLKEPLSIENLLENKLSDKEKKMNKIIRLYVYKTIFNKNGKEFDVFLNKNKKKQYKFDKYKGFKDFFKFEEEEKINYGFESLDNDFDSFFNKIEKYKKKGYDKKIIKEEIIESDEIFIDNFINTSIILILSKLKQEEFVFTDEYEKYYNNICKPFFENEPKLTILMEFLFNPKKFEELQKYGFNYTNIESLLFGLRYSINCLSDIREDDEDKIYATLYDKNKISYLTEKCYPGCNPKYEPRYELYNKILNHFKLKPNDGCYICLCEKGFYQSIPQGFPGDYEKNMKCPNCGKPIGSEYIEDEKGKKLKIINRKDYVRVFKDEDEIDKTKEDSGKNRKLQEINYMTVSQFKENYIDKLYKNDKGLHRIEENYFKKNDKLVRNLSQISYRLLNYILYSHLFFAKLYTGLSENFDKYLPEKQKDNSFIRLSWGETLNECWILLKKELSEKEINYPEIFMNFVFKDLYNKLNEENCLDDFDSLITFEDKLEDLIQKKLKLTQSECKKYKEMINKNCKDKDSCVSLLSEKFDQSNYDSDKYPNYENFYYTDYLDEKNIGKMLDHLNKEKYLVLNKYLIYSKEKRKAGIQKKKDTDTKDYYSLNNLKVFIKVLNLFNDTYSHLISRDKAESIKIEDDEIYRQNIKEVEEFIKFFNELQISEKKEKKDNKEKDKKDYLQLSAKDNYISDLFLDPENKYGIIYKSILQKFIKRQNDELADLLEKKIVDGKIDINGTNRMNIQQIKEDEIFTFNAPDKFSFITETFNSSYRKIIDNYNYEKYNDYVIYFDSIEERLTDLLLKNKKLLNEDIIEFSYNNELFTIEISNDISTFKDNYNQEKLTLDDKEIIYKFYDTNRENKDLHKKIILDFMTLIKYLSNNNEKNTAISEINAKIESNFSTEFLQIFKDENDKDNDENNKKSNKRDLTVNKTLSIFEYFLKFIFNEIKEDLEEYNLEFIDKKLEKKSNDELEKFFSNEEKEDEEANNIYNKKIITKDNLTLALKWFMALVLFNEKDKENKIKGNKKNLFNYLNVADLWDKEIYKDTNNFNSDLAELKKSNIPINKIICLYDFLVEGEKEEDPEKEIKEYIEKENGKPDEEEEEKPKDEGEENEEEEEESPHSSDDEDNNDDEGDN